MAYIKKTIYAGRTIEVYKHYAFRCGPDGKKRRRRSKETSEEQKKINARRAEDNLRQLINCNFQHKDIHLVLTYKPDERPDAIGAKRELANFLRRLRNYFKRQQRELKYIAVTEYKSKAIHHHLVIPSADMRDIVELWTKGKARATFLDDSGQYSKLAAYLIKETDKTFRDTDSPARKRWCASKNLVRPTIKTHTIKSVRWQSKPAAEAGYYIEKDSLRSGVTAAGYEYQFYRMIRLE